MFRRKREYFRHPSMTSDIGFLHTPLELVSIEGGKYQVEIGLPVLQQYGCSVDERKDTQKFKVGHLREHLFANWSTIFADPPITKVPAQAHEIQLFHLGQRLDPNGCLDSLDLSSSHVFHILIKECPTNAAPSSAAHPSHGVALRSKLFSGFKAKAGNTPVPAFVCTPSRPLSGATPIDRAETTDTIRISSNPRHTDGNRTQKGSTAITNTKYPENERRDQLVSLRRKTTTSNVQDDSQPARGSTNSHTVDAKSGFCCLLM